MISRFAALGLFGHACADIDRCQDFPAMLCSLRKLPFPQSETSSLRLWSFLRTFLMLKLHSQTAPEFHFWGSSDVLLLFAAKASSWPLQQQTDRTFLRLRSDSVWYVDWFLQWFLLWCMQDCLMRLEDSSHLLSGNPSLLVSFKGKEANRVTAFNSPFLHCQFPSVGWRSNFSPRLDLSNNQLSELPESHRLSCKWLQNWGLRSSYRRLGCWH